MNPDAKVGQLLKAARRHRDWSQGELARRSGVSQSTIWRIENGLIPEPKIGVMLRFAQALGLGIHQLIGQQGPMPSEEPSQIEDLEEQAERIDLAYELCRTDPRFPLGLRATDELSTAAKRWIVQLYEAATGKRLL